MFCDSMLIAEKFNKQHPHVMQTIDKIRELSKESFIEKYRQYRGQDFRYYEIDIQGFILICLGFNNRLNQRKKIAEILSKNVKNFDLVLSALNNFDFDNIDVKFLYVAMDKQERIKIGISNNPERRIKQLNIGNADELELIFTKESINKGYIDESNLHNKCKDFNIRSEWFSKQSLKLIKQEF